MGLHNMQTTLPNPTGPCAKRRRGGDEKGNMPFVYTHTARDTQRGNPLIRPLAPPSTPAPQPSSPAAAPFTSGVPAVSLSDERRGPPACVAQMATAIILLPR